MAPALAVTRVAGDSRSPTPARYPSGSPMDLSGASPQRARAMGAPRFIRRALTAAERSAVAEEIFEYGHIMVDLVLEAIDRREREHA